MNIPVKIFVLTIIGLSALFSGTGIALAQDTQLNSGDTAWMMTSTALVLFMTIPGLSLFYAGMVRSKNALSVMMQCFAMTWMSLEWKTHGKPSALGIASGAIGGF